MSKPARIALASSVFALFVCCDVATAQCTLDWAPGDPVAGADERVLTSARWDPDGAGPSPEVLVFGGQFRVAGSVVARGLAAWDPASGNWSSLGSGVVHTTSPWIARVMCVAPLANGDLVVGGEFTAIDGVPATNPARWNGSQWSAIGAGVPVAAAALAEMPNGDTLSAMPGSVPPCNLWLLSPFTIGTGLTDGFGMLSFAVPVQPGLVNVEFGLQVGILPSGGGFKLLIVGECGVRTVRTAA